MNHYDDDILYKFVLNTLESSDSELVKNHINNCNQCSNKVDQINKQIELLKSFKPEVELKRNPNNNITALSSMLLKSAAVLLIGLSIGYSASQYVLNEHIEVVGQSFTPRSFADDSLKYVACPNIDIHTNTE